MKMFLPFEEFAQRILESLMNEDDGKISKATIKKVFKNCNFDKGLLKVLPTREYRTSTKTSELFRIASSKPMDDTTIENVKRYLYNKIKSVLKKLGKSDVKPKYAYHSEVSDKFNSFIIPINGPDPKDSYYITISTDQKLGVKNEIVQAENINNFINSHNGKIKIKRYRPNKSNKFDIVIATRSEQLGGAGNKADVVIYGYENKNDAEEKPIMWLSLKAGSSEKHFQQYLDISNTALKNIYDSKVDGCELIKDFLECCKILFKDKDSFGVTTNEKIPDELCKYAIYGRDSNTSTFGPNNVNYLIQGNVEFIFDSSENVKAFDLSGSHVLRHAEIPRDSGYSPKLLLRRANDDLHKIDGITRSRLFVANGFYHQNDPDLLKLLNEEYHLNAKTLHQFLEQYHSMNNEK